MIVTPSGKACLQSELNRDQQKQKIESCPGVLEYFSYMFNFHSFLAGPSCTFREYQSFIDGSNLRCPKPGSVRLTIGISSINVIYKCIHLLSIAD